MLYERFSLKCDFTPNSENAEVIIYNAKFSLNQSFATKYLWNWGYLDFANWHANMPGWEGDVTTNVNCIKNATQWIWSRVWDGVEYQVLSASLKYSYQYNCTTHIREAPRKKICEYFRNFSQLGVGVGFSSIPEHRPPLVRLQKEQESYWQPHQKFTIGYINTIQSQ